ncbi:hypothetical protein GH733_004701 [Mirounga leonina]|nr:hypothetical protein GH733_004701 [Mirounga leonina]
MNADHGFDGVGSNSDSKQRKKNNSSPQPSPYFFLASTASHITGKDALVMAQILKDMGITEYEPRVINQMLEFAFRCVTTIMDDAKIYSSHAKKPNVGADDVRLAIQCRADQSFTSPPPRNFLLDIARQKNQTPLPLIKPYAGPRLPPERYCLTAPNYRLKSLIKKGPNQGRVVPQLSVGAVGSDLPLLLQQPHKLLVTSQRFTVQIPPSQSPPVKSVPATTAVQNVLINPSIIGPKTILITTNMVSSQNMANESNPLKRKHEDDDNDTIKILYTVTLIDILWKWILRKTVSQMCYLCLDVQQNPWPQGGMQIASFRIVFSATPCPGDQPTP